MENELLEDKDVQTESAPEASSEGTVKKVVSLFFFGGLLAALIWLQKNGGMSFLDRLGSESDAAVEERQIDVPELLQGYMPEVEKALERWRVEAELGDSIEVTRLRYSDDLQKLLVEWMLTQGELVTVRDLILERDEFARFVYEDTESGWQVIVYSPTEQRAIGASGE